MQDAIIYKVITAGTWEDFRSSGSFEGSAVDLRDGYVHLSTRAQLRRTLALHFKGEADLRLLEVRVDGLTALRWEPSRGGALFPHHYGPLPLSAVGEVSRVDVDADGHSTLPPEFP